MTESSQETEIADEFPTALYRLYAGDRSLLYVGVTCDLRQRFAQHAETKEWWSQVAKKTVTWHDTRRAALAAEGVAIQSERPHWNVVETKARQQRRSISRHKVPLMGWHPPADLAEWAREEAKGQGRPLSELLTEALADYREKRA